MPTYHYPCSDPEGTGCKKQVTKKGGKCRTCAGLLRRTGKVQSPAAATSESRHIARHPDEEGGCVMVTLRMSAARRLINILAEAERKAMAGLPDLQDIDPDRASPEIGRALLEIHQGQTLSRTLQAAVDAKARRAKQ